jgi:uncharacterized protein (DUF1501 family)
MRNRRHWLGAALATAAGAATFPGLSLAALPGTGDRKLVFVILRGGMDGLYAVPAVGDPDFAEARGALARYAEAPLPLAGPLALHPLLPQLHGLYGRGELVVVHATGIPYRERSHFDAQQVLESGGTRPHGLATGWLGRAIATQGGSRAVALETAVPLVLRGAAAVDTWAPSALPEPTPDLVARLQAMYQDDAELGAALQRARGLRDDPAMAMADTTKPGGYSSGRGAAVALARQAADFLQKGAQIAVLELGGWDSHANQAAPQGALSNNLRTLDALLAALREGLLAQGTWERSAVLVATEFGREVAVNGTLGSDHGSGGAAFVLGGAVNGGRVIADWPGLAKKDRFEGRDLRITTDLRAVQRTLLAEHLGVPRAALDATVLPGSAGLPRLDLLRG